MIAELEKVDRVTVDFPLCKCAMEEAVAEAVATAARTALVLQLAVREATGCCLMTTRMIPLLSEEKCPRLNIETTETLIAALTEVEATIASETPETASEIEVEIESVIDEMIAMEIGNAIIVQAIGRETRAKTAATITMTTVGETTPTVEMIVTKVEIVRETEQAIPEVVETESVINTPGDNFVFLSSPVWRNLNRTKAFGG